MIVENVVYYVCPRCAGPMYLYGPLGVRCTHCKTPDGQPLVRFKSEVQVLTAKEIDTEPVETYFKRLQELNATVVKDEFK